MAGEVGELQQQVAPGHGAATLHRQRQPDGVEGVERTRDDEPLHDRAGHGGAMPEVRQRAEGTTGDDPRDLRVVDAFHIRQRQPDAVALPGCLPRRFGWRSEDGGRGFVVRRKSFDAVGVVADIDVERQHADAELARVIEDQPLGVHAGVMREHTGEKSCRMVGLEPGRLVGGQGERRRMRLAETE